MQLPLPADVLVPLAIGVIVAAIAAVALVLGLRRRTDDTPAPTDADWTGEHTVVSALPVQAAPARTVADAIAARQAHADPFPVMPRQAVQAALEPVDAHDGGDETLDEPAASGPPHPAAR